MADSLKLKQLVDTINILEQSDVKAAIGDKSLDYQTIAQFRGQGSTMSQAILYAYDLGNNINLVTGKSIIRYNKDVDQMSEGEIIAALNSAKIDTGVWFSAYCDLGRAILKLLDGRMIPTLPNPVPISWINGGVNNGWSLEVAYVNKLKDRNWNQLSYVSTKTEALNVINSVIAPMATPELIISNFADIQKMDDIPLTKLLNSSTIQTIIVALGITNFSANEADPMYYEIAQKLIDYKTSNPSVNLTGLDFRMISQTLIKAAHGITVAADRTAFISQNLPLILQADSMDSRLRSLNITGFKGGEPRLPLTPVSEEVKRKIREQIRAEGFSVE